MRKVILLEHMSLDGFVAGPNGEMDWIRLDDALFDEVGKLTDGADTALYGRITYQMMESYWPTAAEQPTATRHDIEHANWVNKASKIVFSKTLKKTSWANTKIIHDQVEEQMKELLQQPGKKLLMIGSPSMAQTFMQFGMIDEYYINVNPVILGRGILLFKNSGNRNNLKLLEAKTFGSGVVMLHYETKRS
jgi:dihydrofolate reductase